MDGQERGAEIFEEGEGVGRVGRCGLRGERDVEVVGG